MEQGEKCMGLKHIVEGKVIAYEDKLDPKNPLIVGVVVFETKKKITATMEGTEYIKAKTLVKPSKIGELLKFEAELFPIKDGLGIKTYYRLLKEVK
jgi:hypothetical protein